MSKGPSNSEADIFSELIRASERIQSGIMGTDYLVLENDDEMYGYIRTQIEDDFCTTVTTVLELLEERGPSIFDDSPKYGFAIITALIQVKPAVDAYRSRMFRYATDWGSEISPVGNCQRELFLRFRDLLLKMKEGSRRKLCEALPNHLMNTQLVTYYWTDFDSHGAESARVIDLFST